MSKEKLNIGTIGGGMKIKEKVLNYFQTYWRKDRFRKSVSLIVAVTFIFNIMNLPAFSNSAYAAKTSWEIEDERKRDTEYYVPDESQGYFTPAKADSMEESISEGKDGLFLQNNKPVGSVVNGEVQESFENVGMKKSAGFTRLMHSKIMRYAEAEGLVVQEETEAGKPEYKRVADLSTYEYENKVKAISAGSKMSEETVDIVISKLAEQSKMSKEDVISAIGELDADKQNTVLGVLADFFAQEGSTIVNCASEALSQVLGVSSNALAFHALLIDISTGVFGKDSIQDGQLMTSMNAMNEVMKSYGKESGGYVVGPDEFMAELQEGESGILWVNENHYITVKKGEEGKFSVTDQIAITGKQ